MEQGIIYLVTGVICILSFFVGKYVFPAASDAINSALNILNAYPMLFNWAVSVCEYLAQYFESIPGEEKNKKAAEFIMEIAKQAGIELTEEQARSIAQAAYESLKNGGKDITEEKKEEGDVKKEVIANA